MNGTCKLQDFEPNRATGLNIFAKAEIDEMFSIGAGFSSVKSEQFEKQVIKDGLIFHDRYVIRNTAFFSTYELKHSFNNLIVFGGLDLYIGINKTAMDNYIKYDSNLDPDHYLHQNKRSTKQLSYSFVAKVGVGYKIEDLFILNIGYTYLPVNIVPIPFTNTTPFGTRSIRISAFFISLEYIIFLKQKETI